MYGRRMTRGSGQLSIAAGAFHKSTHHLGGAHAAQPPLLPVRVALGVAVARPEEKEAKEVSLRRRCTEGDTWQRTAVHGRPVIGLTARASPPPTCSRYGWGHVNRSRYIGNMAMKGRFSRPPTSSGWPPACPRPAA